MSSSVPGNREAGSPLIRGIATPRISTTLTIPSA
jgi:hypothetical protein